MNRVVQLLGDLVGKEVAPELDELRTELGEILGPSFLADDKSGLLILAVWAARRARGAMRPTDLALERRLVGLLERHEYAFNDRDHPRACLECGGTLDGQPPGKGHQVGCEWSSLLSLLRARR